MSRKLRNLQTEMVYHVVCKGNNRDFLLRHDADKSMFLETVKRYRLRYDFELYAFCIMDNHVHMLIKMGTTLLSKVMQGISQSFTQKFNRKYDRSGHVFEGRYFASPCPTLYSIMKAMAYIHLNPFKAGICQNLNYFWSSHYAYSHRGGKVWFDSFALLKRLKKSVAYAKSMYLQHLENFRNDPVYFEYSETDVVQEPMTLDVLMAKLKVNRRFKAVDHLLRKVRDLDAAGMGDGRCALEDSVKREDSEGSEGFGRAFLADGHKSTNSLIKVIVMINKQLKLIPNAELARRLKVNRSLVQQIVRLTNHKTQVINEHKDILLQQAVQSYLSFEQTKTSSEEQHLKNLDAMFIETLRLMEAF